MTGMRWALALMLAAFFAFMGAQKFGASNEIFEIIAAKSGISFFEPYVRMVTGAAEIVAALLLILPKTRLKGALLALMILVGAIGFHLSPWLGIDVGGDMGKSVFIMAMGALVLTASVLGLERASRISFAS